jgi:acetyltransferase-like isoleucine patch superfamily enzyme
MSATRFLDENGRRTIADDWYPGTIPENVKVDASAYVGSSYSFERCRGAQPAAVEIGRGASLCDATSLDVGPRGVVRLGAYALVTAARIICDVEIEIGDYALVSWDVVLMDSYRVPVAYPERRRALLGDRAASAADARPIRLGCNSWVGFGACVLPGVTIGEGAIVAARSVVHCDVPAYAVVAGNPARIVRQSSPTDDGGP